MSDSPQPTSAAASRRPAQPTDLADKFVAFQRRQAAATKPRERPERTPAPSANPRPPPAPSPRRLHAPPHPNPNIVVAQGSLSVMEADADDFSRRLKITSTTSPRSTSRLQAGPSSGSPGRLYNPNADVSRRQVLTAEPEAMSDAASSSYAPRGPAPHGPRQAAPQSRAVPDSHRQLFDHRKDDAVRFSVLARPHASPNAAANRPTHTDRPTPNPKSSGDYVSASSTSSASYAHSTLSSNFTLSSTDSSSPSGLFENPNARRSEDSSSSANAFSMHLKKLYRAIAALEQRILNEQRDKDADEEGERNTHTVGILVKGRPSGAVAGGTEVRGVEDELEKWRRLVVDHKELAEKVQNLLTLTLAPNVPASLRIIPTKYNLIARLWAHAFHRLLESLRQVASPPNNSAVALEYLQEFIYYAYTFYTGLLEERNFTDFRSGWVEALGDLSRYRMAYCALAEKQSAASSLLPISTAALLSKPAQLPADEQLNTPRPSTPNCEGNSGRAELRAPAGPLAAHACIDDSPPRSPGPGVKGEAPSVGLAAARGMELEPEKERWRQIAREWFAKGLAWTPGAGKLHHHIGLLCRERDGSEEELRGMYHFVKSMITVHPYTTSREAILQLWSPAAQTRRQGPDADVADLFILLHGMLFTRIQLDDFRGVLDRFDEKLHIEGGAVVEERDWLMMAVINLGAILEYGRPLAVLRRIAGIGGRDGVSARAGVSPVMATSSAGRVKLMTKKSDDEDKRMDVDDDDANMRKNERKSDAMAVSPTVSEAAATSGPDLPPSLKLGMQFAFSILAHALRKPMRKPSPFAQSTLNPYITIFLTFLATALKDTQTLAVLERFIPWAELATFLTAIPRRVVFPEQQKERGDGSLLLTSGCKPLPEDWCLRGLGWGGKRVYPMGFWGKDASANLEDRNVEVEVLDKKENTEQMDGIIVDEKDEHEVQNELGRRWVRVARAGLKIAKHVDGFVYYPAASEEQRGQWKIEGVLAAKVARWQEEERREREEEEKRLRGRRWDEDSMDVDDSDALAAEEMTDDSEEDENDSPEIKALKARRRYLQTLLESPSQGGASTVSPRRRTRHKASNKPSRAIRLVPGYTILIVDTNILLSSLSMFSSLVESVQWTVVVPLPVIMELDGLATNVSPLGEAAAAALDYITSHIRSHSTSLKVQTSKGNYLSSLSIRTEQVDFAGDEASWERNMDDLILRAAIWQDEHWIDRSALLRSGDAPRDIVGAAKVVLMSFDRMLRVKARSRQLSAASEQDMASILAHGR